MQTSIGIQHKLAHTIVLRGIVANIWEVKKGRRTDYRAIFSRLSADEKGHDWNKENDFGCDDLLVLAKLANEVHTWICSLT